MNAIATGASARATEQNPMGEQRGPTFLEIAALVVVLTLLAGVLLPALRPARESSGGRDPCRSNLCQLAKGMAMYLNALGDNRWYPCSLGRGFYPDDYNGAEWLASLYWTGIVTDPGLFVSPGSGDTNYAGEDLGTHHVIPGKFSSQTVSYAGMHYYSLTDKAGSPVAGAIRDDFPPNEPMASDDTEGTINHGTRDEGGMHVLFFDSHVEFWTNTKIDLERGVGMKGGPLWRLRN